MSAYICDPIHIKTLAIFAAGRGTYGRFKVDPRCLDGLEDGTGQEWRQITATDLASLYADLLYQENIRSVLARYPHDTLQSAPGPCDKPEHLTVDPRDATLAMYHLKSVAILKLCDGLEYQSCETDEWPMTLACRLLNAIRQAAIQRLPGYEEAPWEYTGQREKEPA